jgi:hypothetical protein
MAAEFDDVAGWTADAVEQLGDRSPESSPRGAAQLAPTRWPPIKASASAACSLQNKSRCS